MSALALTGKTIVVTRARHQASHLSQELEALGAHVVEIPTIEIVPPESYGPLDTALRNIGDYQWLIVTSVNTVRVMCERIASFGLDVDAFSGVRCVAIGPATADALRGMGLEVALVPKEYVAESLVADLRDRVAGSRVLLARAAVARDVIPDELRRIGTTVDVVDGYQTVIPESSVGLVREIFTNSCLPDAITFTSSSTVINFFQLLRDARVDSMPLGVKALSIGPITSTTLREHGWLPVAEADPHDVKGLVRAAVQILSQL